MARKLFLVYAVAWLIVAFAALLGVVFPGVFVTDTIYEMCHP